MKRSTNLFACVSFVLFAGVLIVLFSGRVVHAETVAVYGRTVCPDGFSAVVVGQKVGSYQQWAVVSSGKENYAAGVYFTPDVCTPTALLDNGTRVIIPCAICKRD